MATPLTNEPETQEGGVPAKRHDRYRLEPVPLRKQKPAERVHNWNEVFLGFTPEEATHEASRCLECEHAPCVQACPLHNPIPEAMFHIAQGQFAEAALKFLASSNMPDVCGRICPQEKLCEGACTLCGAPEPVRIGKLEAFCVDYLRDRYGYQLPALVPPGNVEGNLTAGAAGSNPAGIELKPVKRGAVLAFKLLAALSSVVERPNEPA